MHPPLSPCSPARIEPIPAARTSSVVDARVRSVVRTGEHVAVGLALAATLGLHLTNLLSAGPFWRDEVGDLVYASMPSYGRVWSMLRYDNFPPLLLVLLRSWHGLGLGADDFGYRVYGCLMGLLIVGALCLNARWLGGRAPWLSLPLFATCGMVVRVGDSIRPYAPGWLFMLLTFGLVWRVVRHPRPGRVALAGLTALLGVHSLYQNAFLLLGIGAAGMLVAARARQWRSVLAVGGISLVAAGSLVPYIVGPIHDAKPWGIVSQTGVSWGRMAGMCWQAMATTSALLPYAWMLALAALVWVLSRTWRTLPPVADTPKSGADASSSRDALLYAGWSVAIGVGSFLVFLKFLGMATMPWYYLLPMALLASGMDVAAGSFAARAPWRMARLAFFLIVLAVVLPGGWRQARARMTDVDLLAQTVATQAKPGDFVVVNPWTAGIGFRYYYRGLAPWETVPPLPDHTIHRYDLVMEKIASPDPLAPLLARVRETLCAGHRVWLVGNLETTPEGRKPLLLRPGPDPRAGWDEGAYSESWSMQMGDYLRAHGTDGQVFPPPTRQAINGVEALELFCVSGWQP